ncbi:hypothetical protein [Wolbachia endosymbiont (group A) of Ophion costatus]|uniref:TomO hydrophobic C-terminal domain-containing protein n=1 Tax=Wolbachia endosymbiont (group A) of Ophion costatus TaxID=3066209 RepID=UPI0030CE2F5C
MKSASRYRVVKSSPSQLGEQRGLDSFKNEIKKEVGKKGDLLCKGRTLQYGKCCTIAKGLATYLTFDLLSNNFTIQTLQTKFKGSAQALISDVRFGTYYEDLEKGLKKYVESPDADLSAIYSKVENSPAGLDDVKSAIYYFYCYLTKMLKLQKGDKKTELEDSKKNTQIFQRKVTDEQASSEEKKVSLLKKENDYTSVTKGFSSYGNSQKDSCYGSESELEEGCGKEISSVDTFPLKKSISSADNFVQQELNQLKDDNAQLNRDVNEMWKYQKELVADNKLKGCSIQKREKEQEELKREVKELREREAQLVEKNKKLEEERSNWQTQQLSLANEVDKVVEPIKGSEEIDGLKKKIDKLQEENSFLKHDLNQLDNLLQETKKEKRKLQNDVDISNKVTQPTEENSQLKSKNGELGSQIQELSPQNTLLKDQVTKLTEEKNQLGEELKSTLAKITTLQQELDKKISEDKNKKPSAVEFQSRKQSNCASVSFILSGVSSVGAGLIMSHLAICISLTVAALTFLAVGCYCLYKASTALSNIEVDQIRNGVNPTASEAQIS